MLFFRFKLFADHFQFVLQDEDSKDDFLGAWDEAALARMLALGTTYASIGTLRNADVDVELHVLASPPEVALDRVDHAVTGSFLIPSGELVQTGCTDFKPFCARIPVEPGTYRLLSTITGVETTARESGPIGDLYSVRLWPGPAIEPRLLKHWKSGRGG